MTELEKYLARVYQPDNKLSKEQKEKFNNVISDIVNDWDNFHNIYFKNKDDIYGFLRECIEDGKLKNNELTFIPSDIFNIYIINDYKYVADSFTYIKEMINIYCKNCNGKFLVCENIDTMFDNQNSAYFVSTLKGTGCRGIIYSTTTNMNNLYQCLFDKNFIKTYKFD